LAGSDPLAVEAMQRFCGCLGSIAGDLALAQGASGVVIAGGLGQRLAAVLPASSFASRFVDKGRFSTLLQQIPVKLILHPEPGLLGAAAAFAVRASSRPRAARTP
jgi:glucokinase